MSVDFEGVQASHLSNCKAKAREVKDRDNIVNVGRELGNASTACCGIEGHSTSQIIKFVRAGKATSILLNAQKEGKAHWERLRKVSDGNKENAP